MTTQSEISISMTTLFFNEVCISIWNKYFQIRPVRIKAQVCRRRGKRLIMGPYANEPAEEVGPNTIFTCCRPASTSSLLQSLCSSDLSASSLTGERPVSTVSQSIEYVSERGVQQCGVRSKLTRRRRGDPAEVKSSRARWTRP